MRIFILLFTLFATVFAQEVEVTADKFSANETSGKGEFTGHVIVTKGSDILKSDKLIINFDKKRKPTKYTANGNATISMSIKGKEYYGSGKKLIYNPIKDTYRLEGDAFLEDKTTHKKIYGNNISVNQKDGKYEVDSKKNRPVKFIFQVDDSKAWQK